MATNKFRDKLGYTRTCLKQNAPPPKKRLFEDMTTIFLVKDFNQYRSLVIRGTDINCSNLHSCLSGAKPISKKDKQG